MAAPTKKVTTFRYPDQVEGCECVVCMRLGISEEEKITVYEDNTFQFYRLMKENEAGGYEEMTDEEMEMFKALHPKVAEWAPDFASLDRSWVKQCIQLVDVLVKKGFAVYFKEAVDPIMLNIPDYPKVVKHPMDLGTVKSNLKNSEYLSPAEFISDVRMIFRNAYVYNKGGTDVWNSAEKLSRVFETELVRLSNV